MSSSSHIQCAIQETKTLIAVSYTHLDVYKRQVSTRVSEGFICPVIVKSTIMSAKRKRVVLSLEDKLNAIKHFDRGETLKKVIWVLVK